MIKLALKEIGPNGNFERIRTAQRFNDVWKTGRYGGFGRRTDGQDTTPLLRAVIERLHSQQNGRTSHVIEGGAGSGNHTLVLAKNGFRVTAVEYSEAAVVDLRILAESHNPKNGNVVGVVQGDLVGFLEHSEPNDAFYANSVLHFFIPKDRSVVYERISRRQTKGGLIAVSFKAEGDALQRKGVVCSESDSGIVVRGDDGIKRLFARDPKGLIAELNRAGYDVPELDIYRWEVSGYNYPGEQGKFIGFLGAKR